MKQFLLIALAAVAVVGCKKNVDNPTIPDNEMRLGAQTANITRADLPSVFTTSSQIGMYSVKKADFMTAFTIVNDPVSGNPQANIGYSYGGTADAQWQAINVDVLKWQAEPDDASMPIPVFLFGYHPYNSAATFDATAKTSIPFSVKLDQSKVADLQLSDLMWAGSTGKPTGSQVYDQLAPEYSEVPGYSGVKGLGIKKTTDAAAPIDMKFNHMLSKLSFKLGFNAIVGGGSLATTEKYKDVKITKIEVAGQEITTKGLLDIKAGKFASTANVVNAPGSISWLGEIAYPDANIVLTQSPVDLEKFVKACDLVVIPQDFTGKTGNQFRFFISYDYSSDNGTTWASSTPEGVKTKTYTTNLPVMKDAETALIGEFARNRQYDLNATLTLSSNEIFITTSIVDWTTGDAIPIVGN